MREIKFRQWDEMWRVMIQWEGEEDGPTEAHQQGVKAAVEQYGWDEIFNNSIMLQYTGMKDTNGKDIFEGDIMKVPDYYELPEFTSMTYSYYPVTFRDGGFFLGDEPMTEDCEWIEEECEVSGNIYENPELLNDGIPPEFYNDYFG